MNDCWVSIVAFHPNTGHPQCALLWTDATGQKVNNHVKLGVIPSHSSLLACSWLNMVYVHHVTE